MDNKSIYLELRDRLVNRLQNPKWTEAHSVQLRNLFERLMEAHDDAVRNPERLFEKAIDDGYAQDVKLMMMGEW